MIINVKVQTTFYVFTVNVIICVMCMGVSAIPYYHYFGKTASVLSMIFSSILMGIFYILTGFFMHHQKQLYIALACLVAWVLCGFAFVGFLSALVVNISPIQFVSLCFAQSIAMVVYTRTFPRHMINNVAIIAMFGADLLVWLISIYGFVVEGDWMAAIVILLLSFFVIFYNQFFLLHVKKRGYNTTWQSTAEAVIFYYCMIGIFVIDFIERFAQGHKVLESENDFVNEGGAELGIQDDLMAK